MADATKEIPHLLVLAVLIIVLLVALTKFQWVHCTAIPGWCNIYCDQIIRSHTQVALIYDDYGIGNERILEGSIREARPNIVLTPFQLKDLSSGLLKRYDLVILTRAKNVTSRQTQVLFDYLNSGGSLVLVGDSATEHTYDMYDILLATQANQSFYDRLARELWARNMTWTSAYANQSISEWKKTEQYDMLVNSSLVRTGFRKLTRVVGAAYNKTIERRYFVNLSIAHPYHLITKGLMKEFQTQAREYAIVYPDPASTEILAFIEDNGERYPGIIETRYSGRVIYFSFPPEFVNSNTLFTNVWDYLVPC
ncbi:hypothetical protein HZC09_03230 [Candidatus Micrarchaeota archaeon]|nr:hypothetical protein [Candidatus Micrarchaeota archaeon]